MLKKKPIKLIKEAVMDLLRFYKTTQIGLISPEALKNPECVPQTELYITNESIDLTYLDHHGKNKLILNFNDMTIKQNSPAMGMNQFIDLPQNKYPFFSKTIDQCFQEAFKKKLTLLLRQKN